MSLHAPRGADLVAARLAALLARAPSDAPRLAPLPAGATSARVAAVDGSSVVLAEMGDRILVAFRGGSVRLEKGHALPARVPPPEVALLSAHDARAIVAERIEADGFPAHGIPSLVPAAALDLLRSIDEARAARDAVETLEEGDLLLLDGALRARAPQLDAVLARAAERGVDVVGVCKSTTMTIGGAPALAACLLAGRSLGANATWWAPLPVAPGVRGASFAARLSAAEARAFRLDVASGKPEAIAKLVPFCGHPAYPGYPSPLAMAHNAVLITDEERRRMLSQVREAALAAGADARALEAALVDYHDVLELGA